MSWDPKAERIAARGQAQVAEAEAERIRAEAAAKVRATEAETRHKEQKHKDERREERRKARQKQREALAKAVRGHADKAVPAAAIGAPAVIAWNGQYEFAADVMHLGALAPLLPVAIEGSVLYCAMLAHQAITERLPVGRYRATTWGLAFVAASMNCWHGATETGGKVTATDWQVGVALGLTSLLGIGLLELTIALKQRAAGGRSAAEIRQSLIRRICYPRLSAQAAAIAAARGIDAEAAWRAAWIDRYGIGPDSTRRERRTARKILARQRKADRRAAKAGALSIDGDTIVRRAGERPEPTIPAPPVSADDERPPGERPELERPVTARDPQVREWAVSSEAAEGIAAMEEWLSAQASAPGTLRELPPGERPDGERAEGERSPEDSVSAQDRPTRERPKRRLRRKVSARDDDAQDEAARRLEAVRNLLSAQPDMSGADIATALSIPPSTARRLRARVLRERKGGGER